MIISIGNIIVLVLFCQFVRKIDIPAIRTMAITNRIHYWLYCNVIIRRSIILNKLSMLDCCNVAAYNFIVCVNREVKKFLQAMAIAIWPFSAENIID